jgi:hypothetical protein
MILYIIGGILAAIGIVTFIIGCKKIKINNQIKLDNQKLEKDNIILTQEHLALEKEREKAFYKLEEVKSTLGIFQQQLERAKEDFSKNYDNYVEVLELAYSAKEVEYDSKLNILKSNLDNEYENHKKEIWDAFQKYIEILDTYYQTVEADFDKQVNSISKVMEEYKEKLEQIKQTYAAAREAQIRDYEISQQSDFYSLHLTEMEQITINILEELKPKMPTGARPICKLIWETFFQKQATSLCNNVLGSKTVCGIYKITNKNNGLCYVGQSVDVADRWKQHIKCGLGIDTPAQNKLYKAMLKDGVTNFTFELLEQCDKQLLNEKERFYINLYQAYEFGYNSTSGNK